MNGLKVMDFDSWKKIDHKLSLLALLCDRLNNSDVFCEEINNPIVLESSEGISEACIDRFVARNRLEFKILVQIQVCFTLRTKNDVFQAEFSSFLINRVFPTQIWGQKVEFLWIDEAWGSRKWLSKSSNTSPIKSINRCVGITPENPILNVKKVPWTSLFIQNGNQTQFAYEKLYEHRLYMIILENHYKKYICIYNLTI